MQVIAFQAVTNIFKKNSIVFQTVGTAKFISI